jgi:phosphopantetheine--protein transferase-like protein
MDIIDVYVASVPSTDMSGMLAPPEREREVREVKNETLRREKYFVWRLLDSALRSSLGISCGEARLYKSGTGKWCSPLCEISLAHSGGVIAAAVSSRPVGIDLELAVTPRAERFAERIMTPRELSAFSEIANEEKASYLTRCWTKKEALFKMSGGDCFVPSEYDSMSDCAECFEICVGAKSVTLAVASEIRGLTSVKIIKI